MQRNPHGLLRAFNVINSTLQVPTVTVRPSEPLTLNETNIDFMFANVRARFEQAMHGTPEDPRLTDEFYFRMIADAALKCAEHAQKVQQNLIPNL